MFKLFEPRNVTCSDALGRQVPRTVELTKQEGGELFLEDNTTTRCKNASIGPTVKPWVNLSASVPAIENPRSHSPSYSRAARSYRADTTNTRKAYMGSIVAKSIHAASTPCRTKEPRVEF